MEKHGKRSAAGRRTAAGLFAIALSLGACGDGEDAAVTTEPAVTAPASTAAAMNYFTDPAYVGQTVTVNGTVTRIIGPTSFVMDASPYGEDALLVISAPAVDAEAGKNVEVTGVVQKFSYEDVSKQYGLGDDGIYEDYNAEEILVVGAPTASGVASASPSASPAAS